MFTNCVIPPELDDEQLLSYLDKPEADPTIASHLNGCQYCRKRTNELDRFQKRLTNRLYRISCPTPLELGEYYMRMLPASRRLVIAQHVRECLHCKREIGQLEGFMSETMPKATFLEMVKVLIARLVSGGSQTEALQTLPALRGSVKNSPVFEADGMVISLDVQSGSSGELSILGQMAADQQDRWKGATVELKQPYLTPLRTTMDDLGAFSFDAVDPGSIQLTIQSPEGDVVQTEEISITI